jgi:20S proteasome alpha/beta subunit
MNEHRDLSAEDARRVGTEAVGRALHGDVAATDVVEVVLYINGRMIHTKTDDATVARIMAILTGTGG